MKWKLALGLEVWTLRLGGRVWGFAASSAAAVAAAVVLMVGVAAVEVSMRRSRMNGSIWWYRSLIVMPTTSVSAITGCRAPSLSHC